MEHNIPFGNSNRENGTTFLDFPLFLGIFQWDEPTKRVPFTAEPEIPEILTKWKAPMISAPLFHNEAAKQWSRYGLSTCMHFTLIIHLDAFCYFCILQWSEIVQTCPLCKSSFSSIIHSVKSMDNYQQVIKFSHLYQRLLGAHIMSLVLVAGMLIPSGWKSSNIDSRALIL